MNLSVLPKFGKKFSLRFFSAGGNGGTVSSSRQNVGKKFSLRYFSAGGNWRKCVESLAWNDTYECQLGLQIPDFNFQLFIVIHESPIRQVRK